MTAEPGMTDVLATIALDCRQAIAATAAAIGCQVAVHDWSELLGRPGLAGCQHPHHQHRSAFCRAVKRRPGGNEACRRCDLERIPALCNQRHRPFVHRCHAGADEIILPLLRDDAVAVVVYLGPFRRRDSQSRQLPRMTPVRLQHALALARSLQSHLDRILDRIENHQASAQEDRRRRIVAFIDERLQGDPPLADLAAWLGLSPSRTSHVVRQHTGLSYSALKRERRLAHAGRLLRHDRRPIAAVARACGFTDPNYFARCVREAWGCSPSDYRARQSPEA